MSDDEVDHELLAFLRSSLALGGKEVSKDNETKVLKDAEFVCDNSVDVAIDSYGVKAAALNIWARMQKTNFSLKTWSTHELHPKLKDESTVNFIFTMDLLNFCFWSDHSKGTSFAVDYQGSRWTGYWSLLAAMQRALQEGVLITKPDFWLDRKECTDELLQHVFRSDTSEPIPLLEERISCLREAGQVLHDNFNSSFVSCIEDAKGSATSLVNLLVDHFPCFRDESRFEGRTVRFYKRAQILVADIWACFQGEGYGHFYDIDQITMFADYRVPQILNLMGCLQYSPSLDYHIKDLKQLSHGHPWEVQLRGCSIWCVELIRRQIMRQNAKAHINAILIDFFLYDTIKEMEGKGLGLIPHHRTRSIWY